MRELLRRLWIRLWPVISGVSLRVKIMGIALLMIAVLGLGLTAQTRAMLAHSLERELEQRALSIARDLAFRSTDLILTNNLYSLYVLMRETVRNNEDVRYAFVVDPQGNLLAHSFEGGFPPDLLTVNGIEAGEAYHREVFQTEEGLVQDVAVPVFGGRAGTVRVGMSYRRLEATVGAATRQLLLTTLGVSLLGVGLSSLLTWLLTRPVRALEEATRRVAEGDLSQRVSPWADDEIGRLQRAFNEMVEHLERSRREMEAFNRDLIRRNRELSTLYRVSRVLAGPTELERALEEVLGETVAALGAEGGWVCLTGREETCRVQASFWAGTPRALALSECPRCAACLAARARGQPAVLSAPSAECPACPLCNGDGATEVCHAVIPLLVKGESVGVLSVVGREGIGPEDLGLLEAVGRQVGVGIENARLWEEVRQKEAVRRDLLHQLMTAQEEERRRIARELHDEAGQALTSLLVSLRLLENAASLEEVRALVAGMREVVSQTLDEVHNLAVELRPSVLDDLGLVPALARTVQGSQARFGVRADLEVVGLESVRLPEAVETAVYRIAQEALTNAARHAGAQHVSIVLERRGNTLVLIVEDDGRGFDVEEAMAARERGRLGLHGMAERASLVGGRLTVESAPGSGTTVVLEVPCTD
ncbi:MAG: HAMP domain-containing protein [Thermoflexales bacterium]|nr:HAMP domain-containing protein [Thermoflexales bacterium]